MKKKHRTQVPDFARKKPDRQQPDATKPAAPAPPAQTPRVKPQSTSAKSGRRGQ